MTGEAGTRERGGGRWPSLGYLAAAILLALWLWAFMLLLGSITTVLLLAYLSIVFAFLLHYPIGFFSRFMPRGAATLVTLALVLAALAGALWLVLPTLYHQATDLTARIPQLLDQLASWWAGLRRTAPLSGLPEGTDVADTFRERLQQQLVTLIGRAVPVAYNVLGVVIVLVLILALAFFLAYRPDLYSRGIVLLVPRRHEELVASFLERVGHVLRGWALGTLVSMTFVGTVTSLGLYLIGVESWLLLGIVSFFLEFIPYFGPWISAVPGIASGLLHSPRMGISAALVYLVVQQIEGNAITPLVMRRAVRIPPALLLVWQVAMAAAFGVLALVVATPLLAAVMTAVDHFYVRATLGKRGPDA